MARLPPAHLNEDECAAAMITLRATSLRAGKTRSFWTLGSPWHIALLCTAAGQHHSLTVTLSCDADSGAGLVYASFLLAFACASFMALALVEPSAHGRGARAVAC